MSTPRAAEIDRARRIYRRAQAEGHGTITFIAGPASSGRTAVLRELARALPDEDGHPQVLAGRMSEGVYVPWTASTSGVRQARAVADAAVAIAGNALPLLPWLKQVVTAVHAAGKAFAGEDLARIAVTPRGSASVLRSAVRDRPLVCIVDDVDQALGTWWSDLLLGFAEEIARDLPLHLVVALEGGADPGAHQDDENDALGAARVLTTATVADWIFLAPVGPPELAAVTGPANADVLGLLDSLSEGNLGYAAGLWGNWRQTGVVERDTDLGPWSFAPGQPGVSPGSIGDVIRDRLTRLTGDDPLEARRLWNVLACAALEGPYFTADAVAMAMGWPPDTLIDLLDDYVTVEAERPDGIVEDVGHITARDGRGAGRSVCRYRFAMTAFRAAFARYGLTAQRRRELSSSLAEALETIFVADRSLVLLSVARLYAYGERPQAATSSRRRADLEMPAEAILESARAILERGHHDADPVSQRRASALLTAASWKLYQSGSLDEVIEFGQEATLLARLGHDERLEADALFVQGAAERTATSGDSARAHLGRAAAIRRSVGDRDGEGDALRFLAMIEPPERAKELLAQALSLHRSTGNTGAEVEVHRSMFKQALNREGDLVLAERHLDQAAALTNSHDEMDCAILAVSRGDLAAAKGETTAALGHYEDAIGVFERIGQTAWADAVRLGIGRALAAQHRDDANARQQLLDVIVRAQSRGDLRREESARRALAELDRDAGEIPALTHQLQHLVRIYKELGDPRAATVEGQLQELEA